MAYYVNGKVYTDHPLMDEMIYNLNIIMKYIEIKNEDEALSMESKESIESSDTYMSIMNNNINFSTFPFTKNMLMDYGYDSITAQNYSNDKNEIPKNERNSVFDFCCQWFLDNYVEKNNYYRTLNGLPWIDENGNDDNYYVYIDDSYIKDDYFKNIIDFNLPLHKYNDFQISILKSTGVFDTIFEKYNGKEYKYLHFLGDSKLNIYTVRKSIKWDIIYMPTVERLVSDRFKQLYEIERDIYIKRFYSESYKIASDYYDEFMIIMLLCQTYTDMIVDIPEWYIKRDIFDLRSCQYFLESHGISFFKVIPLKYQIKIVKNINRLIKYKSTNKNIWDLISIFNIDATVYKYYLFKKRIVNINGSYAIGKNPNDEYLLEFIKTPIGESYDDFIKNNIYRVPYDDITYQDKYWDGLDTHENVKNRHMSKDFTIEGTKYLSIENKVSINNYLTQIEYFLGLVLDSSIDINDIKININSISELVSFPLSDLFILLYCLTAVYDGYDLKIVVPENKRYVEKPEFFKYYDYDGGKVYTVNHEIDLTGKGPEVKQKFRHNIDGGKGPEYTEITQETFYDWLSWKYPSMWTNLNERIYGFNMKADLNLLADVVGFRHSTFKFEKGYTLEELGVSNFRYDNDINSIEQLIDIYQTNIEIYNNLKNKIITAETRDQKVVFEFVLNYLFTRNYDYEKYTITSTGELADTYDQILKEHNSILYNFFKVIISENNLETKQEQIRTVMNDIINTLDYYLNYDCLDHIFNIFTISSFNNILYYLYLMINFFKSFKVSFLDNYISFVTDNKVENHIGYIDNLEEIKYNYWKNDRQPYGDSTTEINIEFEKEDSIKDKHLEIMEVYGHYEDDPTMDLDLDGCHITDIHSSDVPNDYNGGGISLLSCSPYIVYNGGVEGAGRALFDLDGGGVKEHNFIVDVDGTTPDPKKEPHRHDKAFSYSIEGGHVSMYEFSTGSIIVKLNHDNVFTKHITNISFYVKLAESFHDRENKLIINSDGLYIKDEFVNFIDYQRIILIIDYHMNEFETTAKYNIELIIISRNPDLIMERIHKVIQNYIELPLEVISNYHNASNMILNNNNRYTSIRSNELYNNMVKELIDNGFDKLDDWGTF